MIRTMVVALFLLLFFVVSLPLYVIIPFIAKFNQKLADRISQNVVCKALVFISSLSGMKVVTEGMENIPKDEAVLFIGNHRSYFDIVATYPLMINRTGYVAKQELDKIPLLKYWLRLLHGLTFDRHDPRSGLNMIKSAIELIKSGYSVFIFPEGTRIKEEGLGEFRAGSFKVATRTGCAIIPVAILGSDNMFERHVPAIRPSEVRIRFGAPIRPADLSPEEKKHIASYVKGKIETMLKQ